MLILSLLTSHLRALAVNLLLRAYLHIMQSLPIKFHQISYAVCEEMHLQKCLQTDGRTGRRGDSYIPPQILFVGV